MSGLPVPGLPALSVDDLVALLLPAVGVAIVGYSDNVLTARAFATRRGENIDGTRSCWPSAPRTWPPVCCAGSR